MSAGFGNAAILAGNDESLLGGVVSKMLDVCRHAQVEPLAQRRTEALQRKWRGEDVSNEELLPGFGMQSNWDDVSRQFPAIGKGPGTHHRTFAVAQITEREGWKSRQLVQVIRSKHAACEEHGDSARIPLSVSTTKLGTLLMEHLRSW